jgi:UPF0755 protein
MIRIIKTALTFLIIVVVISSVWFFQQYQFRVTKGSGAVLFEIIPGQSVQSIARNLHKKGIIQNRVSFMLGYRLFYSGKSLKAGEYMFHLPVTEREILRKIISGQVRMITITIPEGLTSRETAAVLGELDFLNYSSVLEATENTRLIAELDAEATDLEGYLFPETYLISKNTTSSKMIETMTGQFKRVFNPEWRARSEKLKMSIREVVTLASLIEKETSLEEEKPLVSAVFHNRLSRGMKLACDPTIIYALKQRNEFYGNLTKKHLELASPYNTYLYPGLPPGPIANPGAGSLQAALFPADVNYLYFVSRNDGSHKFSSTYREHVNAVNKYQKRRRP